MSSRAEHVSTPTPACPRRRRGGRSPRRSPARPPRATPTTAQPPQEQLEVVLRVGVRRVGAHRPPRRRRRLRSDAVSPPVSAAAAVARMPSRSSPATPAAASPSPPRRRARARRRRASAARCSPPSRPSARVGDHERLHRRREAEVVVGPREPSRAGSPGSHVPAVQRSRPGAAANAASPRATASVPGADVVRRARAQRRRARPRGCRGRAAPAASRAPSSAGGSVERAGSRRARPRAPAAASTTSRRSGTPDGAGSCSSPGSVARAKVARAPQQPLDEAQRPRAPGSARPRAAGCRRGGRRSRLP